MKKVLFFILLPLIFSCGGKSSENLDSGNVLEDFTFSMDTMVIDPKGEIIDLAFGVNRSSVSLDGGTFYYFDMRKTVINEVDLDKLELKGIHPFSKEGPNAVGFNPPKIQSLGNDRFLILSPLTNVGIYTKNGQKEKTLKFNFKEIEGLVVDEEGLITNKATLSHDEKLLFALTKSEPSLSEVKLMVINPEKKTGKSIVLPNMLQALKFSILLRTPNLISMIPEMISLKTIQEKLYITSSVTSDVYVYDYVMDSLQLIEFHHQVVPRRKTGELEKNILTDEQEFEDAKAKQLYQVAFMELIWDDQRKQFFRFAHKPIPDFERKWYNRADVYLFVYELIWFYWAKNTCPN